jgi:ElaB/YqjD/DUF883 family membrane-anchored ribosome-binding protein
VSGSDLMDIKSVAFIKGLMRNAQAWLVIINMAWNYNVNYLKSVSLCRYTNSIKKIMETNELNQDDMKKTMDSLSETFKSAADEAKSKAKEAAPKVKEALKNAAHDAAYGAAYGASFAGALAAEFLPQSVKDGLDEGSSAGKAAAQKTADKYNACDSNEDACSTT